MNTVRHVLAAGAALFVAASAADAQIPRSTATVSPSAQSMPTGTCRVWIDGVPASRQPAPTDCTTARRNQPRNSRIIYGSGSTNVYGNRDPRSIPGTPQYDPRYDPRSSQYDPRLDPHNRANDQYDRRLEKEREKAAREREKEARKREHEREKAWKREHKGNGHDDRDHDRDRDRDRDDDRRYGNRGRSGTYGTYGTAPQGCADVNRDGRCDGGPLVRRTP